MKKILMLAMGVGLLVSGCAVVQTLPTQSGRPEVTIIGVDKKQIKDAIVNACLSGGFTIKSTDDYTVICAKRNESFDAVLIYGTRAGGAPEGRVTFTLVDVPNDVRVFGWETLVVNPNTAFENVNDATNPNQAQEALENLKSQFNLA